MLPLLAALVLWIPAVLGWGLPWAWFRRQVLGTPTVRLDIVEPICGLAMLAGLATWLNVWWPIDGNVIRGAWVAGLLLLALRWRLCGFPSISLRWAAAGLAGLTLVAFAGSRPPLVYDAGLYYLQAMAWIRSARALPGLANLHGRFAFSPIWFPLAAIVQPLDATAAGAPNLNLLTSLLFWLFGLAACRGFRQCLSGQWTRTNTFLALSLLALATPLVSVSITSPAADLALLLFSLLCVATFLQFTDEVIPLATGLAALVLLALFSAAIKLSATPLLLFPLAFLVSGRTHLAGVRWAPQLGLALGLVAWVVIPGLVRSTLLSGCLFYPVSATCLPQLPWRVPLDDVRSEAMWIISWARWPGDHLAVTLTGWGWLKPWWEAIRYQVDMIETVVLAIGGLIAPALTLRPPWLGRKQIAALAGPALPLLAGLVYWFFTAPDPRFGAGYLWGLGLLSAAVGLVQFFENRPPYLSVQRLQATSSALIGLTASLSLAATVFWSARYWVSTPPTALLLQWPAIPSAVVARQYTNDGVAVWVPVAPGDQCWFTALPCAMALKPGLSIHLDAAGQYQSFEVQ